MKTKTKRVKNDKTEIENVAKISKKTTYKYKEGKEKNREEKKKKRKETPSEQKREHLEKKKEQRELFEQKNENHGSTPNAIIRGTLFEKQEKKKKKRKNRTEIEAMKKNYKEASIVVENMKKREDDEREKKRRKKEQKKQKEKQYKREEGSAQVLQMSNACKLRWFGNDDAPEDPLEETKENIKQEKTENDMRTHDIKKETKEKKERKEKSEDDMRISDIKKFPKEKKERKEKSENNMRISDIKKDVKEKKEEKDEVNEYKNTWGDREGKCKPVDFERLVASARNSSAVWISYIGYYIEQGNINEARKVAERALKSIDMNKTEEKLNIYLCYLNMECLYGNRLEEVFKRALIYNDEKQIYMHMIYILKKSKKLKQLKEICEKAIKKYKHSKKMWVCYLEVLHDVFKDEETAHEVLLKSLHSLAKRKHLHMIISAARFEYKYSNKERGKAYFEKLIAEFPKRSDIWFTYLDVHISSLLKDNKHSEVTENEIIENEKIGKRRKGKKKFSTSELESVRNIFERFCALKFKPRVMKLIFTKWLFFERNHGSPYHEKMVQQKAFDYVESLNTEE